MNRRKFIKACVALGLYGKSAEPSKIEKLRVVYQDHDSVFYVSTEQLTFSEFERLTADSDLRMARMVDIRKLLGDPTGIRSKVYALGSSPRV